MDAEGRYLHAQHPLLPSPDLFKTKTQSDFPPKAFGISMALVSKWSLTRVGFQHLCRVLPRELTVNQKICVSAERLRMAIFKPQQGPGKAG